mgnify:CR=1 FL=1
MRAILWGWMSQATISPLSSMAIAAAKVLPPGAAQTSSTRSPRASGMVNAVLRRLSREKDHLPALPEGTVQERLSLQYSHPAWLTGRLLDQDVPDEGLQLLEGLGAEAAQVVVQEGPVLQHAVGEAGGEGRLPGLPAPADRLEIALFGLTALFQLVTLPVEFNASARALRPPGAPGPG